jgi:hypothetical protein
VNSSNEKMVSTENQPRRRFHWDEASWYIYSRDEGAWTTGATPDNETRPNHKQDEDLVVVTWNVLFDIFDAGLEADERQLNCSGGATNPSQARWEMLASILHSSEPDLVSLQEATPAFVKILLECEWIKAEYACSASPSSLQSVSPSGGKPYYPFQKHSSRPTSLFVSLVDIAQCFFSGTALPWHHTRRTTPFFIVLILDAVDP